LAREGQSLSPAAVAAILKEEGFAKLPRRRDEERPDGPRPVTADVAEVRQLDLAPRALHTKFGGLFLFLPDLVAANLDGILARSGFPGSEMVPAACAMRSLLALKLFGTARHRHVMSYVLDEGLALFAGLNAVPKRSFLTEYSCRIAPSCYPRLDGRPGRAGRRDGEQPDAVLEAAGLTLEDVVAGRVFSVTWKTLWSGRSTNIASGIISGGR
jgi:hypothetical protein